MESEQFAPRFPAKPRVFLPHVPTRHDPITEQRVPVIDLTPASKFGELVPLIGPTIYISPAEINDKIEKIHDGISTITDRDYIVAIGDPVLIAAAITYSVDTLGTARVLRWDKQNQQYMCVEVHL